MRLVASGISDKYMRSRSVHPLVSISLVLQLVITPACEDVVVASVFKD